MSPRESAARDGLIPFAIVLGACIIAAGLFFGLRGGRDSSSGSAGGHRDESAQALSGAVSNPVALPQQLPPLPAMPPLVAGAHPPEVDAALKAKVTAAVESRKPSYVEQCWRPLLKVKPKPDHAVLTFSLGFDARGHEVARGIQVAHAEVPAGLTPGTVAAARAQSEAVREDVGFCLSRLQDPPLVVEGTGQSFSVEVELAFP